jgi:hypothetical protein
VLVREHFCKTRLFLSKLSDVVSNFASVFYVFNKPARSTCSIKMQEDGPSPKRVGASIDADGVCACVSVFYIPSSSSMLSKLTADVRVSVCVIRVKEIKSLAEHLHKLKLKPLSKINRDTLLSKPLPKLKHATALSKPQR